MVAADCKTMLDRLERASIKGCRSVHFLILQTRTLSSLLPSKTQLHNTLCASLSSLFSPPLLWQPPPPLLLRRPVFLKLNRTTSTHLLASLQALQSGALHLNALLAATLKVLTVTLFQTVSLIRNYLLQKRTLANSRQSLVSSKI
jgi:hypothetical protein